MKNTLEELIDDFHQNTLPPLIPRTQSLQWIPGKAQVITGMRRTGKTWFCYQQIQKLLEQGIPKERFIYLNFEDERLLPFSTSDFQLLLETYYRKFPDFKNLPCYLFLDEIQLIPGWDKFVRRILDSEKLWVCLTGSSSKLLSSEIPTSLRGRGFTTEIFPLSFQEFIQFHHIESGPARNFGSKRRAILQHALGDYFLKGGFPEVQHLEDALRTQVLQDYANVVLFRDVVERHNVRNIAALRALTRHLFHAPANRFSLNKFYNSLKSQGISCTKNDLYAFLEHLTDAFLFYQVPIHSRSEAVRRVNPQKIYAVDVGLLKSMSLPVREDLGALLENLVYLHLRRQKIEPEYYVNKKGEEVDFIFYSHQDKSHQLVQVCWSLKEASTKEREVKALETAMQELKIERATIVTWLEEGEIGKSIQVIPVWRWLLG